MLYLKDIVNNSDTHSFLLYQIKQGSILIKKAPEIDFFCFYTIMQVKPLVS